MATEAGPNERRAALIATIAGMYYADGTTTIHAALKEAERLADAATEMVGAGGYEAWCQQRVNERHRGPAV